MDPEITSVDSAVDKEDVANRFKGIAIEINQNEISPKKSRERYVLAYNTY